MTLRLNGSTSGYVEIDAPATAGSNTLVLPTGNGSNGQVLSTNGSGALSWVDRMTAAGPAFAAYLGSNQSITNNVFTKLQINTELFDTNTCYDSSTNYRFTPNVAGYYQVNAAAKPTTDVGLYAVLYKNGSILYYGSIGAGDIGGVRNGSVLSALVQLNGSTDYVEFYVISGTNTSVAGSSTQTYFSASMVRPA